MPTPIRARIFTWPHLLSGGAVFALGRPWRRVFGRHGCQACGAVQVACPSLASIPAGLDRAAWTGLIRKSTLLCVGEGRLISLS